MCAEVNIIGKGWENPNKHRNEAWDLSYYCIAGCISKLIQVEKINWDNPPDWAKDWDDNSLVFNPKVDESLTKNKEIEYDFAELARRMG